MSKQHDLLLEKIFILAENYTPDEELESSLLAILHLTYPVANEQFIKAVKMFAMSLKTTIYQYKVLKSEIDYYEKLHLHNSERYIQESSNKEIE